MASRSPDGPSGEERRLAGQRAYYRHRAPKYDEWWQRVDRYDRGKATALDWVDQVDEPALERPPTCQQPQSILARWTGLRYIDDKTSVETSKVFYEPDDLAARPAEFGWRAKIAATSLFIYGSAEPDAG